MIVDQFHDPTLATLAKLVETRPKIAAAISETEIEPDEEATLPDTAFAWQEKRAMPIHSREHTILSCVYRENATNVPKHVDTALKEACDVYEISPDLFAREKTAAPIDDPEDYLLPAQRRVKVTSAADVKTAEEKLLAGYQKLSVESRALACKRLMDKAASFGVTLNPLMHKLAGFTVTSTDTLTRWLEARKEAAPSEYKESFQKLADAAKKLPHEIRDRATQLKLADVIDELDQKAGLRRHYDRKLPDPLMTVFNTDKTAGSGVDLNGKFISTARLASYPSTFYADVLGDDFVREASDGKGEIDPYKMAMILETLPRDLKTTLARQMR